MKNPFRNIGLTQRKCICDSAFRQCKQYRTTKGNTMKTKRKNPDLHSVFLFYKRSSSTILQQIRYFQFLASLWSDRKIKYQARCMQIDIVCDLLWLNLLQYIDVIHVQRHDKMTRSMQILYDVINDLAKNEDIKDNRKRAIKDSMVTISIKYL